MPPPLLAPPPAPPIMPPPIMPPMPIMGFMPIIIGFIMPPMPMLMPPMLLRWAMFGLIAGAWFMPMSAVSWRPTER